MKSYYLVYLKMAKKLNIFIFPFEIRRLILFFKYVQFVQPISAGSLNIHLNIRRRALEDELSLTSRLEFNSSVLKTINSELLSFKDNSFILQ